MSDAPPIELSSPELYTNRESSWLSFNARVLAAAERKSVPLLERLKFVGIAASNLDEFYMVRIAGLMRRRDGTSRAIDPSGDRRRPGDVLEDLAREATQLSQEAARILNESLLPELRAAGVVFLDPSELDDAGAAEVSAYYRGEVHPCLTPIAIDPAHPFPHLRNLSLNIALRVRSVPTSKPRMLPPASSIELFALVQVPSVLPRFVPVGPAGSMMLLEDIIAMHGNLLFPGHEIIEARPFRVTRASDLEITEEETDNLLTSIQDGLRRRDWGDAVRLEVTREASPELTEMLREMLQIEARHVQRHPRFIATKALIGVAARLDRPNLQYPRHAPVQSDALRSHTTLFRTIAERDVLLHHPYESFAHVVDLMNQAADDPDVVAIKQTLYRTSGDSPFVRALARAAANGKQVTALVELKARFDEAANIQWARALEEGGVHVVYGLLGLKTHCKLLLIIRREGKKLRRYLHLGTGNYNSTTARLYTDLSLLTADEAATEDALLLFNVLTGYAELPAMNRLIVSPFNLREHILEKIDREIEHARGGRGGRIVAEMNALVDPEIIEALYRASGAGVSIDLLIRGICCLRPGLPGVSENIRVRAVIDRFLEHARIAWFGNGGEDEVFLSSADWMPRNLNRRIEVTAPVMDPALKKRICEEILGVELADTASSWTLASDGTYHPNSAGDGPAIRLQTEFVSRAKERGRQGKKTVRRKFAVRNFALSPASRAVRKPRPSSTAE